MPYGIPCKSSQARATHSRRVDMITLFYIVIGFAVVLVVALMLAEIISLIVDAVDEKKRKK